MKNANHRKAAAFLWLVVAGTAMSASEAWTVREFVGKGGSYSHRDGPGSEARFQSPTGLAVDAQGRAYVSDDGPTLRRIDLDGTVTTIAGVPDSYGLRDGPASQALFSSPRALVLDGAGNLFIADQGNHTIRKLATEGEVTTVAGVADSTGSDNGPGAQARFYLPRGLALGADGDLYVADQGNQQIRRIDSLGVVTRFAFRVGSAPEGIEFDPAGDLIVADWQGAALRRVSPDGTVSALPGNPDPRYADPTDVAFDADGRLFIADTRNECIRLRSPDGQVTVYAGVIRQPGGEDGPAAVARFRGPRGVAVGPDGSLWVADTENNAIRKIGSDGVTVTIAGLPIGSRDGLGSEARLNRPGGLAVGPDGDLWISDTWNRTVRRATPDGRVITVAGLAGVSGFADGPGAEARFVEPTGIAVSPDGLVYIADTWSHTLRRWTPDGVISTLAGTAWRSGAEDGLGTEARFNAPRGLALDRDGSVLVADAGNHCIRKVTPAGEVTTVAGLAGVAGSADGPSWEARFQQPENLCVASDGSIYVSDSGNSTLRRIGTDGIVSTVAGVAGSRGHADGPGATARFSYPHGLVLDSEGNLYAADNGNRCIRKIAPDGRVTTVAGKPGTWGSAIGTGEAARFFWVTALAMAPQNRLFIADSGDHVVRLATPEASEPPALRVAWNGSDLELSWQGFPPTAVLHAADALGSESPWQPVAGNP
ncbi:MAG: SMP-30/gluconolactonase/LRE family protein, partial [Verrucomicrobiae bacterium]|nr:SMP-30/gluconolactonase/LRE family protein [Verrucomicrobiae bacterium]